MRLMRPLWAILVTVAANGLAARGDELLPADRPIEAVVDHYLGDGYRKEGVEPAAAADDATMVRRLTLDLAGRIPTLAEAQAYVESTDPAKALRLIDRLMATPSFVRHQVAELDTMLMAGTKGSLREYLTQALGENRPWDQIFRELMLPDETDKGRKSAGDFLRPRVKDLDRLTYEVSATFFGVNISCAQCHDHPLVSDWKQDHFYGMKAFLSRTFDNGGFLGERGYGTVKFTTTEGLERQTSMMFLTGRRVEEPDAKEPTKDELKAEKKELERAKKEKVAPPAPKFSARAQLVEVALAPGEREYFAKSIVNRVWNRLFGRGLVMPLDQMHSANPPSHPELLDWLARDTIEHGYDLRRLIQGLVSSQGYARSSRWEGSESPRPALFAVAAIRPLSPLQLATSLRLATTDPASFSPEMKAEALESRVEALEGACRSMAAAMPTKGGDAQIGVAEGLLFSNGASIARELLADGSDRLVGRLKQTADRDELIDLAVRNVLSRSPDAQERQILGAYLAERTDRPEAACRQLIWALLTCAEFRFNH